MPQITTYNPTHRDLCERAAHWLQNSQFCKLVLIERNSGRSGEEPDAIGWSPEGSSFLIEVKVSRSDFLADRKKPHRINPETGMGRRRYLLCPKGMIQPEEVPEGWGLLWATHGQIRLKNSDDLIDKGHFEINHQKEMQMLIHNFRLVRLGVMIVPMTDGGNNNRERHPEKICTK
jgi:hypothetical protein